MQNPRGNVSIVKHINLLSISEGVELHSVRLAKFCAFTKLQTNISCFIFCFQTNICTKTRYVKKKLFSCLKYTVMNGDLIDWWLANMPFCCHPQFCFCHWYELEQSSKNITDQKPQPKTKQKQKTWLTNQYQNFYKRPSIQNTSWNKGKGEMGKILALDISCENVSQTRRFLMYWFTLCPLHCLLRRPAFKADLPLKRACSSFVFLRWKKFLQGIRRENNVCLLVAVHG